MQFNQASRGQGGFTLIELIVVIVILGILAATALPKFADMSSDARRAKMQGARGAVSSAAGIARGQWLVIGTAPGTITLDNQSVAVSTTNGFPTTTGIQVAAGLDSNDYAFSTSGTVLTISDNKKSACSFTYDASNGAVTAVAAQSNC